MTGKDGSGRMLLIIFMCKPNLLWVFVVLAIKCLAHWILKNVGNDNPKEIELQLKKILISTRATSKKTEFYL